MLLHLQGQRTKTMKMDGLFFKKMDIHPGKLYIWSQEIRTTEDDVRIA